MKVGEKPPRSMKQKESNVTGRREADKRKGGNRGEKTCQAKDEILRGEMEKKKNSGRRDRLKKTEKVLLIKMLPKLGLKAAPGGGIEKSALEIGISLCKVGPSPCAS